MTLCDYLKGDGRLYRYVGTIWGTQSYVETGERLALWLRQVGYGGSKIVDSPDKNGWYISWNNTISYKSLLIQEIVLELCEEK